MSKNVVITGANRGIGLAMTKHFLAQGEQVFALCRQASAELSALAVNVIENVDVASESGLDTMVSALAGVSIDVLVCNAGILRDESLGKLSIATIREQFEVNALAPLCVVERLHTQLNPGAKVALITSRMGSIADNSSGGRYGYRMSKAALNAAAMSLRHDLAAQNIAVGIYHPGYVQTDMVNYGGDISANEAAGKLVNLINQLTMAESGVFKHSNGSVLPW
ncbi:NAD(P)-dependent dehydrogenase, short-chain alcohol dehydrogenase family [Colwellia chukchiensis]|uniref:NAD(P)-dependent dehydrogenase, short-chain alcohol dehydrogenase family n=1 Tax=Colwellia chukchiensis TaxID=641665 RepID=A0A1H7GM65_9GAMM|nr:SDR family oxidoreductase [Colwellia chukchiensis]SEK37610.1 NAD(P)-dependent dehydrogenase, short-chain alcohol dehydrogenase family [Colwellia chukchiensis]